MAKIVTGFFVARRVVFATEPPLFLIFSEMLARLSLELVLLLSGPVPLYRALCGVMRPGFVRRPVRLGGGSCIEVPSGVRFATRRRCQRNSSETKHKCPQT